MKLIKSQVMLTFLFPILAALFISLSGCKKKPADAADIKPDPRQNTATTTIDVKSVGAVGNGVTDDTRAFQKAIDSVAVKGGGTVYVPQGTYLIDADVSIIMKSGVNLDMVDSTRILKARPTASERSNVIRMVKISDSKVIGGKIQGERYEHLGTTGEWGMGIAIYNSTNVTIDGTVIVDCWGDGIVIGSSKRSDAPDASKNCVIKNVISRNNRRQGLTIGGVDSLIVDSCAFTHTNGTMPMAGIDIEPDYNTAERVYITNCEIAYNAKVGVEMNAKTSGTSVIKNITVKNNYIHHNSYSAYIQHVSYVKMYDNRLIFNDWNGSKAGGNGNVPHKVDATFSVFTPNTYE